MIKGVFEEGELIAPYMQVFYENGDVFWSSYQNDQDKYKKIYLLLDLVMFNQLKSSIIEHLSKVWRLASGGEFFVEKGKLFKTNICM